MFLTLTPAMNAILRGGIGVVGGGAMYAAASLLLGADQVRMVARMLLRKA
jgi:hypothetical protein